MINSKFKIKKLFNLILQVFTYTFIILIISSFFIDVSFKQILISLLPVTFSHYWFITDYVILYMLSPFINKLVNNINKKELCSLILILVTFQSIMNTFLNVEFDIGKLGWFITIYLIGAYIKKYYNPNKKSIKINIIGTISSYLLLVISVIGLDLLSNRITLLQGKELHFTGLASIFVLINSIFLFLLFRNMNIGSNKFINKISSTTLGIYIIHENVFLRNVIWKQIVKGINYANSPYLIVHAIISVIGVFVVCSAIELIRQALIAPLQDKFINFIVSKENNLKVVKEKVKKWL